MAYKQEFLDVCLYVILVVPQPEKTGFLQETGFLDDVSFILAYS